MMREKCSRVVCFIFLNCFVSISFASLFEDDFEPSINDRNDNRSNQNFRIEVIQEAESELQKICLANEFSFACLPLQQANSSVDRTSIQAEIPIRFQTSSVKNNSLSCDVKNVELIFEKHTLFNLNNAQLLKLYKNVSRKSQCEEAYFIALDELSFRLQNIKATYESLRDMGTDDREDLQKRVNENYLKLKSSSGTSIQQIDSYEKDLAREYFELSQNLPINQSVYSEPKYLSRYDYNRMNILFLVGYEYASLNSLKGKGFPRIGIHGFYRTPLLQFHAIGQVTSSAEKSVELCGSQNTEKTCDDTMINEGDTSIEGEML